MSQIEDDFFRQAPASATSQTVMAAAAAAKSSVMGARSSFKLKQKKINPYDLDFTELRKQYVRETTIKMPFVKSSFAHYQKCPRSMKINGKEYKDLVLTMEIIQAPKPLSYFQLKNQKEVIENFKQKQAEEKKNKIEKMKKEMEEARALKSEQKRADRARQLEELKAQKAEIKRQNRQSMRRSKRQINDSDDENHDEDDDESYDDSEETEEEGDEDIDEQMLLGEDSDFEEYRDEQDYEDQSDDYGYEGSGTDEGLDGEDRQYSGDMFKDAKPEYLAADPMEIPGHYNVETDTTDACCISIWSTDLMRFTRLKTVSMRVPPLADDPVFRIAHDAKRLYYIGMFNGKKVLAVVWLDDLSFNFLPFGAKNDIETLEDSSLFFNYLCYKKTKRVPTKVKGLFRKEKDFIVLDMDKQEPEVVWEIPQCERVFFRGQDESKLDALEFQDGQNKRLSPDLYKKKCMESDFEIQDPKSNFNRNFDPQEQKISGFELKPISEQLNLLHQGIMVVKAEEEECTVKAEKQEDKLLAAGAGPEQAADKEEEKEKKETKKFFRTYFPQWGHEIKKNRLHYETSIEVKPLTAIAVDKLVIEDEDEEKKGETKKKAPVESLVEENEAIMTTDFECKILCLIIKGVKGEQHRVFMFNVDKKEPITQSSRAGNTELEFNMSSNIRHYNQIFIVETLPHGDAGAKQLSFKDEDVQLHPEESKIIFPPVEFTNPEKGTLKDCWLTKVEGSEIQGVISICKSSTDEYLNANSVIPNVDYQKERGDEVLFHYSTKVRAQEIIMSYPIVASNRGLAQIVIQSMTCPDQVNFFELDREQHGEFVCFADFSSNEDIGFKDQRRDQANMVPFTETGDKIAFLTRKFGECQQDECQYGDMILNVLTIDSFSKPMKFVLYSTTYEACMKSGMSDDSIQKAITVQLVSNRGMDVAFIAQYNDRIIFDCVTSTTQLPLRFPSPANPAKEHEWESFDPDYMKDGIQFEDMAIAKGVKMIRQTMIKDADGAIYFMTQTANNTVNVLRTDPYAEMGGEGFVKSVFTLRSSKIYFLLFHQNQFYMMDDLKKVRVFTANPKTFMWKQTNLLELAEADANEIVYADFDEYAVSDGVLHQNDKLYFLLESKSMDNPTWQSAQIMLDNHLHVSGPRYAKESGLIWYMQKHGSVEDDENTNVKDNHHAQEDNTNFKGYSIVMMPLADLSFIDLLPQRGENNNNFITFVNDQNIFVNYSGRYLIFDLKGIFQGEVKFMANKADSLSQGFRSDQIKLKNVSDSGKFFVFEGNAFLSQKELIAEKAKKNAKKQKKAEMKKNAKSGNILDLQKLNAAKVQEQAEKAIEKSQQNQSGGKKAPQFYVFKLDKKTNLEGKTTWKFVLHKTDKACIFPFIEPQKRQVLTQRIDHNGVLSQCLVVGCRTVQQGNSQVREMELIVKVYKCEDSAAEPKFQPRGMFDFGPDVEVRVDSEERYRIAFDPDYFALKKKVLEKKVANEEKRVKLKAGSVQALQRLQRRLTQIERAWVFDNYVVAKMGCEIKYIRRETSVLQGYATQAIQFAIEPGMDVWIENVFSTGIEDLIQLFVIDDTNRRIFIVTWNLLHNREHSIFQSSFAPDVFPENLIIKGSAYLKQQDFNYFMDNGAIINLESNVPIQFFDPENEVDTMPKGPLTNQIEGMKRISTDRSRYLDMVNPGRVHHFISYADILYWERFQLLKDKHEISKGTLSTFSPIARFPAGISVFHYFATDMKVLNTVQDAMTIALQERSEDSRVKMLPLVFLHSNPQLNKPGKKTTPIHIALDKQSPISFETMFGLLVDQHKICVTSQLLDVLEVIINQKSQTVLDFFNNSFLITEQYSGLRALEWDDPNSDEKIVATSCAYLTDPTMQQLVSEKELNEDEENNQIDEGGNLIEQILLGNQVDDAPFKYDTVQVEPITHETEESNLKQIEAKILDFNWVFIGDNTARLIKILASTSNDEIFATDQIRVFVDFMWIGYFDAIFDRLFLPFLLYFASFIAYTGYFSHFEENHLSFEFIVKICCLVTFGKTFITFCILEIIQLRNKGLSYFFDVWNLIDLSSLVINAVYVGGEVSNNIAHENLQIVGCIAVFLMWIKLFYWMRLFKSFSAFIRMITEIISDIKVFLVMLLIALGAFTNVIYVLNINRKESGCADNPDCGPIYEPLIGFAPIDALIHAYLTGLGDFNKDSYSAEDATAVWVMFILATIIVQLIFLNLLIAIMGESYSRISAIKQQSTLMELCMIMEDHIWLQKISEIFQDKRYILWLTPDTSTSGGTAVERQILQLKEQVKTQTEAQEQRMVRATDRISEEIAGVKQTLDDYIKKQDEKNHEDDDY